MSTQTLIKFIHNSINEFPQPLQTSRLSKRIQDAKCLKKRMSSYANISRLKLVAVFVWVLNKHRLHACLFIFPRNNIRASPSICSRKRNFGWYFAFYERHKLIRSISFATDIMEREMFSSSYKQCFTQIPSLTLVCLNIKLANVVTFNVKILFAHQAQNLFLEYIFGRKRIYINELILN